ncbi:hypothetical protein TNCV_2565971 [Trichonephila clavipes]|nr:hypothetical protein TNCV_2565971 [Trichonephila clavipes]
MHGSYTPKSLASSDSLIKGKLVQNVSLPCPKFDCSLNHSTRKGSSRKYIPRDRIKRRRYMGPLKVLSQGLYLDTWLGKEVLRRFVCVAITA